MMTGTRLSRSDVLFVAGCALVYAAVVLLVPPYTPLTEPDSAAYIAFSPFRPAYYPAFLYVCKTLGLGLVEITWVQLAIFAMALAYLLTVLLRSGFPKILLGIMVAILAANVLFSSFHRSILTESIYFSLSIVAVALWIDYLRTARLPSFLGAGLVLGLMIGIRLAGLGLLPLHVLAVWVKRPKGLPLWLCLVLAIVPSAVGAGGERLLYYVVHRSTSVSQAPYLLFAKAAMVIRPDMTFSGPHASVLKDLGAQLYGIYGPLQRAVSQAPSLAVGAQLSAVYEALAQYSILTDELKRAAQQENTSIADLQFQLARQVIMQNLGGYLKLTLLNELGQWSVAAQKFPLVAHALNAYADANPGVSAGGRIPSDLLHPKLSLTGLIVYPAFLIAGAATLVLGVGFIAFLLRPALASSVSGFYLLIATFLSAMCHGYTLFISLVNEWTPRFLMAMFPHLEIIALCVVLVFFRSVKRTGSNEHAENPAISAGAAAARTP